MSSLANELVFLRVWFDMCFDGVCEMTADGTREFSRRLGTATDRAAALEGQPKSRRRHARPGNVVAFPGRRRTPMGDGGGDAA